jgi:hypothetical protein
MCQVLERSRAEGTDLLVLLAIAKHAYPDGTGAYPSEATILTPPTRPDADERFELASCVHCGSVWSARRDQGGLPARCPT